MSFLADALDWLESRLQPTPITIRGLEFSTGDFKLIQLPPGDVMAVRSLTGFIQFAESYAGITPAGLAGLIVHVAGPDRIELVDANADDYGRRVPVAVAEPDAKVQPFPFGRWLTQEEFVIAFRAAMKLGIGNYTEVLTLASNIQSSENRMSEDDGVSQVVTVTAGVLRKAEEKVPGRVTLAPLRGFPELEPVASDFVFRIQSGSGAPKLALFEADGGRWRIDAADRVKTALEARLAASAVQAVRELRIIA